MIWLLWLCRYAFFHALWWLFFDSTVHRRVLDSTLWQIWGFRLGSGAWGWQEGLSLDVWHYSMGHGQGSSWNIPKRWLLDACRSWKNWVRAKISWGWAFWTAQLSDEAMWQSYVDSTGCCFMLSRRTVSQRCSPKFSRQNRHHSDSFLAVLFNAFQLSTFVSFHQKCCLLPSAWCKWSSPQVFFTVHSGVMICALGIKMELMDET